MATSSSDEGSLAPKDFQLSTSSESGSRLGSNRRKCPLCSKFRKTFHCHECIRTGVFAANNSTDRYTDKQKVLIQIEDSRRNVEKSCTKILENKRVADVLRSKIRYSKERNRILKSALEEKKQRKQQHASKLNELKEANAKRSKYLPKYEHKVHEVESYVASRREKVQHASQMLDLKQHELKKIVRLRLEQLFKYIFPITKIKPQIETGLSESDDMVTALAEASQTTYISDRWEYTDYSSELKYSIVSPTLPGSGNYSAYNIWVVQNRDVVPGGNVSTAHNPAYSISAALTYTAQCVNVLSYYLNVRLPYKMFYSDFCNCDMNEHQFSRKVARLNANILYLCIAQNVDLSLLKPSETIHNIIQLIEDERADLGRQGPVEVDLAQALVLEQGLHEHLQLCETHHDSEEDSEEGDSFPVEWEAVPHVQCPEVAAGPINTASSQMMSTQQASASVAGGLVTSAAASFASIWRGFTGR